MGKPRVLQPKGGRADKEELALTPPCASASLLLGPFRGGCGLAGHNMSLNNCCLQSGKGGHVWECCEVTFWYALLQLIFLTPQSQASPPPPCQTAPRSAAWDFPPAWERPPFVSASLELCLSGLTHLAD